MSESKSLFADYHETADIWARRQAFDQLFKIPTVQTCRWYYAKHYPCGLLQSLSLKVCLCTLISCYLKKIVKIGFPELEKKCLQRFRSFFRKMTV